MSYRVDVQLAGEEGHWYNNKLRFATEDEATQYSTHLTSRWSLVTNTRPVEAEGPPTHTVDDSGAAKRLAEDERRAR